MDPINKKKLRSKAIISRAPVDQAFSQEIGADARDRDAADGLRKVKALLER